MVKPFSRSKRTPVRLRHKIEKRSAAKQRKEKKQGKQNPEWRSRLKKDPGIPNLFPFKDKILAEIEEKKRVKAEEAAKKRGEARALKKAASGEEQADVDDEDLIDEDEDDEMDEDEDEDESNPMAALLASAQSAAADYEGEEDDDEMDEDDEDGGAAIQSSTNYPTTALLHQESSRRAFDKIFKQVLEASDVILYVLDARDPMGTRSQEVERQVMASASGSKRLILILNKVDLVPPQVLKGWLIHLRRYFPTLPLRASTSASNAQTFNHKALTAQSTSSTLLKALKSFAHSSQLARSISVGVIGYPNVGKSSVINALTSQFTRRPNQHTTTACPVGSEAGVTTALRTIKLDSKLTLLDSPGIVFPSITSTGSKGESRSEFLSRLTLLSALPPKQISDPIPAVTLLLNRLSTSPNLLEALLQQYSLPALVPNKDGDTTTDFLVQVARKRGRLGKGGVPNLNAAAMQIVVDWRDGRIKGWVEPPTVQLDTDTTTTKTLGGAEEEEAGPSKDKIQIVKAWSKEFSLEGLWGDGRAEQGDDEEMQV